MIHKILTREVCIVALLFLAYYFRLPIYSIFTDSNVAGHKYIGLVIDGESTNGFAYMIFKKPYHEFTSQNAGQWKNCKNINMAIKSYMDLLLKRSYFTQDEYKYVSESYPNRYNSYIQVGDEILLVRGFPDFGGAGPSEQEKKVCDDL